MLHLGDITKIDGAKVPIVDVITGGSPCQDLSAAGKRAGLEGERSGLFMEQLRIIKEMREHDAKTNQKTGEFVRPRYMVWENVQGAFSSNGGEDFRIVLEETARVTDRSATIPRLEENQKWSNSGAILGDGWSIAWRLHSAEFWGKPSEIAVQEMCLRWGPHSVAEESLLSQILEDTPHPKYCLSAKAAIGILNRANRRGKELPKELEDALKSQCQQENAVEYCDNISEKNKPSDLSTICIQGNAIDRADTAGCNGAGWCRDVSYTLNTIDRPAVLDNRSNVVCLDDQGGSFMNVSENITGTLRANAGGHQPLVTQQNYCQPSTTKAFGISAFNSNAMKSDNPKSGIYETDTSKTLDMNGGLPACNQGGIAIVQAVDLYNQSIDGDVAATVTAACGGAGTSGPKVMIKVFEQRSQDGVPRVYDSEVSPTLNTMSGGQRQPCVLETYVQ